MCWEGTGLPCSMSLATCLVTTQYLKLLTVFSMSMGVIV